MKYYLSAALICLSIISFGQSTYVPLNKEYYHLMDRYEILDGKISPAVFTTVKPYERKAVNAFVDSLALNSLSKADQFNLQYLKNDNWEWSNDFGSISKKPILKYFYHKKSDMFSIHNEEFDLHVNPVVYFQMGKETANSDPRYINTRGLELRGMINNKVGFYTFLSDNQAQFPTYANDYINNFGAVPGEGYIKKFKTNKGYDFISARGYITFNATKNIQIQFGHDKNFIGNGYRSLVLSDFSSPYTFLKVNTKIWKFNYMNLFAEMNAGVPVADQLYPKKYFALHHLSFNVSKKLNIGIFESVVFGRSDSTKNGQFDLNYLNPIIFYRAIEQHVGSSDNALLGMDYKWNFLRHFSLYGQVLLDEFVLNQVKSGKGWWANKQAVQTGLKYINAFGIKNLDLQGEVNVIRPYTYQHINLYTSYTNYNQPLAHPLGANVYEMVGIVKYQPTGKLTLTGVMIYDKLGKDTSSRSVGPQDNYGGNPLKSYNGVGNYRMYGNRIAQGISTDILMLRFTASYQLKHNLFIDFTQVLRKESSAIASRNANTAFTSVAVRWNIPQRLQDF